MNLKEQLERQLVANVIKDKCKQCKEISFDESICTQERIIRFFFDGHKYEIENQTDTLIITCEGKSWTLTGNGDPDRLFRAFDEFLLPIISTKPKDALSEGKQKEFHLTKYERNPKARAACLAVNGTACSVCGIDFGKEYGPEFAGQIEVHHIIPLSEIGEEYIVDPVKDLVPVCPNCHTALHSKKDGVYTVDELKIFRNR